MQLTTRKPGSCISESFLQDDPRRGERMSVEAVGLFLDYSKNRVTDETLKLLLQLAEESGLRERRISIRSTPKV